MKYLLDTDVLINHLRGREILDTELLVDGVMSIISLSELFYGVYKSSDLEIALIKLQQDLELLNLYVQNLTEDVASKFGQIKADLEVKGRKLDDFDLLIATVAIVNDLILVTRNLRHFERIKGLKLYKFSSQSF